MEPFGVQSVNENGERIVQIYTTRDYIVGYVYHKKKDIHKYKYVSKFNGKKILIDYMVVRRLFKDRLKDEVY